MSPLTSLMARKIPRNLQIAVCVFSCQEIRRGHVHSLRGLTKATQCGGPRTKRPAVPGVGEEPRGSQKLGREGALASPLPPEVASARGNHHPLVTWAQHVLSLRPEGFLRALPPGPPSLTLARPRDPSAHLGLGLLCSVLIPNTAWN